MSNEAAMAFWKTSGASSFSSNYSKKTGQTTSNSMPSAVTTPFWVNRSEKLGGPTVKVGEKLKRLFYNFLSRMARFSNKKKKTRLSHVPLHTRGEETLMTSGRHDSTMLEEKGIQRMKKKTPTQRKIFCDGCVTWLLSSAWSLHFSLNLKQTPP